MQGTERVAMPSNKDKVTSYLEDEYFQAIKGFCQENDYSYSEAVAYLIKKHLVDKEQTPEALVASGHYDERLESLEGHVGRIIETIRCHAERAEKLEEEIAYLQYQLDSLQTNVKDGTSKTLSDEQIAAITGQSEWKVRLWRHAIQKPRGKRIKQKLDFYEVVDGMWRRRV